MKPLEFFKKISASKIMRRLNISNWKSPSIQALIPGYVAFLGGLLGASLFNEGVAFFFLKQGETGLAQNALAASPVTPGRASQKMSLKEAQTEFKPIFKRNLFNKDGAIGDSPTLSAAGCELVKSTLPLKLTGLIYAGKAEDSLVLLETNGQADTFLFGDTVPGDVQIVDITKTTVVLQKGCRKEFLELNAPVIPTGRRPGKKRADFLAEAVKGGDGSGYKEDGFERDGGAVSASRTWLDAVITRDLQKTLQGAKAVPNMVGSEVKGYVITRILPDSVYEKMGLKDGDVIESINGIELNDAGRAIATLNAMRNEEKLEVKGKRADGNALNMRIQVK